MLRSNLTQSRQCHPASRVPPHDAQHPLCTRQPGPRLRTVLCTPRADPWWSKPLHRMASQSRFDSSPCAFGWMLTSAVEGARGSGAPGGLECNQQLDCVWGRGQEVQSQLALLSLDLVVTVPGVGSSWTGALLQLVTRPSHHERPMGSRRAALCSGRLQHAAALRSSGVVALARETRVRVCPQHCLDGRQHATRRCMQRWQSAAGQCCRQVPLVVLCRSRIHLWCRVIEWKNYSATLTKSGTIQVIDAANGLSETLGLHGSG